MPIKSYLNNLLNTFNRNLDELNIRKFFYWSFFIGLCLHFLASLFSAGYHDPDEQYQILEFANNKLGFTPDYDLAWEHYREIRSWFLPGLYYLLALPFKFLSLDNPFFLAFIFRFFSGFLAWVTGLLFTITYLKDFSSSNSQKIFIFLSNALWFLPYLHVRTTGENIGACFFVLGILLYQNGRNKFLDNKAFLKSNTSLLFFVIGSLWGMAFLCRFQLAVFLGCFCLWMLLVRKHSLLSLMPLVGGYLFIFGIGILVDYWGYGKPVVSFYNYLNYNIFVGKAAKFGVSPWWDYLRLSFLKMIPPISLVILSSFFIFWIKKPKHYLTWTTLPFCIIHSMVAHKEFRFLFPMIFFIPYFITILINEWDLLQRKWSRRFLKFCLGINFLLLVVFTLKPATIGIDFYKHLAKFNPGIDMMYVLGVSPFSTAGPFVHFYNRSVPSLLHFEEIEHLPKNKDIWVFTGRGKQLLSYKNMPECHLNYTSYPLWVLDYNIANWIKRSKVWALFRCRF